jgi:hypothetical protein
MYKILLHLQWCSVCDPAKILFHIQVHLCTLFATPTTHESETGGPQIGVVGTTNSKPPGWIILMGANRCGGLLIANHLDESLWWVNQKHSVASRFYLSHSFPQVRATWAICAEQNQNHFAEPNWHKFGFSWIDRYYAYFQVKDPSHYGE